MLSRFLGQLRKRKNFSIALDAIAIARFSLSFTDSIALSDWLVFTGSWRESIKCRSTLENFGF